MTVTWPYFAEAFCCISRRSFSSDAKRSSCCRGLTGSHHDIANGLLQWNILKISKITRIFLLSNCIVTISKLLSFNDSDLAQRSLKGFHPGSVHLALCSHQGLLLHFTGISLLQGFSQSIDSVMCCIGFFHYEKYESNVTNWLFTCFSKSCLAQTWEEENTDRGEGSVSCSVWDL